MAVDFSSIWNPFATPAAQISYPGAMKRKPKKLTQAEQSRRFIEAAREAGVDTSDMTLGRIVRQIVKPPKKTPRKK